MLLEAPIRRWKCPSCLLEDQTQRSDAHTQFHNCPALNGMNIPMAEVKNDRVDARQVVVMSETGPEVASVRTERGDGSNDVTVFAQTATISLEAN